MCQLPRFPTLAVPTRGDKVIIRQVPAGPNGGTSTELKEAGRVLTDDFLVFLRERARLLGSPINSHRRHLHHPAAGQPFGQQISSD
jgi:hypothetical protein